MGYRYIIRLPVYGRRRVPFKRVNPGFGSSFSSQVTILGSGLKFGTAQTESIWKSGTLQTNHNSWALRSRGTGTPQTSPPVFMHISHQRRCASPINRSRLFLTLACNLPAMDSPLALVHFRELHPFSPSLRRVSGWASQSNPLELFDSHGTNRIEP
jgi:hypothetical protein